MVYDEELKKKKSKNLRYKKPICKNLNLDYIKEDLWEIQGDCEEVRWYVDEDDGTDTLINALDGDTDEAWEFKMAFCDLCADCENLLSDLQSEWVPECFDIFFVAIGAGNDGLLGWDSYERDYYGIGMSDHFIEEDMQKKLQRMSKKELIEASCQCFRVYHSYMGLRCRYDSLKAAIDILKNENSGILQAVQEISRMYDEFDTNMITRLEGSKQYYRWEKYINCLPQETWL